MTQFQFETVTIETRPCLRCKKKSEITVLKSDYELWQYGELIQKAFPEMPLDQRELLQTGIHPECWETLFPKDKNDQE